MCGLRFKFKKQRGFRRRDPPIIDPLLQFIHDFIYSQFRVLQPIFSKIVVFSEGPKDILATSHIILGEPPPPCSPPPVLTLVKTCKM